MKWFLHNLNCIFLVHVAHNADPASAAHTRFARQVHHKLRWPALCRIQPPGPPDSGCAASCIVCFPPCDQRRGSEGQEWIGQVLVVGETTPSVEKLIPATRPVSEACDMGLVKTVVVFVQPFSQHGGFLEDQFPLEGTPCQAPC